MGRLPLGIVQGGKIVSANKDARFKVKDVGKINFFIYYEVDGDTSKHSLQLACKSL